MVDGTPYATTLGAFGDVTAMMDLNLKNYYIETIHVQGEGYGDLIEMFEHAEEDQNEAFQILGNAVEASEVESADEEGFRALESAGEEPEEKNVEHAVKGGPRRVEVKFRGRRGRANEDGKRVVLVSVTSPAGRFAYTTAQGREWGNKIFRYGRWEHDLLKACRSFNSTDYWPQEVVSYEGGPAGSIMIESFKEEEAEKGWAAIEKYYYKFKKAELAVLRTWEPHKSAATAAGQDDDDAWDDFGYGGYHQHWTQRGPAHYAPRKAYFRVAGDEIGVTLHREQSQKKEKTGVSSGSPPTLKEMLAAEKASGGQEGDQKKAKAPGTVPPSTTSPRRDISNPRGSQSTGARFCDCGSPTCEDCYWGALLGEAPPGAVILPPNRTVH